MAQIRSLCETLPGIDCGACGAPTCRAFAEDQVKGVAPPERQCAVLFQREQQKEMQNDGQ